MRHLCVLCVFLMSGTFVFACLRNVRCAGSFLSWRHLSVHRFRDIPMFASLCLIVVRALGSAEKRRSKTSLSLSYDDGHSFLDHRGETETPAHHTNAAVQFL